MHTNVFKSNLAGKAAAFALVGGLALTMVPAAPALAEDAASNDATTTDGTDTTSQFITWKDLYAGLGVDTSTGYDAVTSATNFTSAHGTDIPTIVHRVNTTETYKKTNRQTGETTDTGIAIPSSLDGVTGTNTSTEGLVQVKLQAAVFNDGPSSHYSREFAIYPDDTVDGYTWTDYKNSVYAVTISDGTTTAGAVPWIDYYGESTTSGAHYNKLEVALENGTSIDTNQQNVTRFAKFFDSDGNLKTGTYTVTVYAKGYTNLTAKIAVNPSYTGEATATDASKAANALALSGLPSDIKDAKVTVYHTEGSGRTAVTTYLAGERSANGLYSGADINADGTVSLDAEKLAGLADDSDLTVRVESSNYQPITLTSKVAATATFPNTLKATGKTKTVKAKKVAKKKQTVKAITVTGGQGKITYAKKSGSKKLTVNKKSGAITVKKGTKKGTYKVKVKVTAAGNDNFAKATQTVTATVKVK